MWITDFTAIPLHECTRVKFTFFVIIIECGLLGESTFEAYNDNMEGFHMIRLCVVSNSVLLTTSVLVEFTNFGVAIVRK